MKSPKGDPVENGRTGAEVAISSLTSDGVGNPYISPGSVMLWKNLLI